MKSMMKIMNSCKNFMGRLAPEYFEPALRVGYLRKSHNNFAQNHITSGDKKPDPWRTLTLIIPGTNHHIISFFKKRQQLFYLFNWRRLIHISKKNIFATCLQNPCSHSS